MATSVEPIVQLQANGKAEPFRHVENHLPCIWGDQFTAFTLQDSVLEAYKKENEGLKEQVRAMLMEGPADEKMYFIDSLHRLGVSYHFEKEINAQLENMFNIQQEYDHEDYDLYTTSLHFRVFREHGFKMSCDVFNKFKDGSGFKESLATDIKGMLSLYEASHLSLRGEDVLDEALTFTTNHLKRAVAGGTISHISPLLEKQVTHALWQPFYHGIPRIETRFHISVYEEEHEHEHESSTNYQLLLKFAKMDFNILQLLYKQELSLLYKWLNSLEFLLRFPYNKHVRIRLVECFFFAIALIFEPCHSVGRKMLTKISILIILTDDIFDGYGTIEELKLFTDAMDKWEVKCMDQLPDYMKHLYNLYLETFNGYNDELIKDGRSYGVYYEKQATKKLVNVYLREANWFKDGKIQTFDEYMEVAGISCAAESLITTTFMGMDSGASKEVFEWLEGTPKILQSLNIIGRLHDDLVGTELEAKATAVHSYMKQYGVCEKEAMDRLLEMLTNAWKDMNEEWLNPTAGVPLNLLLRLFNLARFMNVAYKLDDGFDHPKHFASFVNILLVDPIPV